MFGNNEERGFRLPEGSLIRLINLDDLYFENLSYRAEFYISYGLKNIK